MNVQYPGEFAMAGQGSTGNVIAAVCSFFIPGLGQLVQGRVMIALVMFVLAALLWFIFMAGWCTSGPSLTRRCGSRNAKPP
jgi:TM2 domain-containing membrane protein YozV